jgi:serine phosphatase RsbU (regulator of sigma subunit)
VLLAYVALQVFCLFNIPNYWVLSWFMSLVFIWWLNKNYQALSSQPLASVSILLWTWWITSLIPLHVFRIFFLSAVAFIFIRRLRNYFREIQNQRSSLQREKDIVGQLMAELSHSIKDVANLQESLTTFLKGLLEAVEGKAAVVYLYNPKHKVFYAKSVVGYFFPLKGNVENLFTRIESLHETLYSIEINENDQSLIWESGFSRKEIYIPFAREDKRVVNHGGTIQSMILEPLVLESDLLGVLVVQNKAYERYFNESDLSVVRNFSHHATMMINSARLLEEREERQRVAHELGVGHRIQSDLLPSKIPEYPGIKLAGSMEPAKEIGGDYFDFIEIDQERLAIVIGDVSGKGVGSGMIMTIVHTMLHSLYAHFDNTRDLMIAVNTGLDEKIKSTMFVTLLYFEYNAKNRVLKYTACGHEHILIYRQKTQHLDAIKSGGLALGMTNDVAPFIKEKELDYAPGDTVVLYTDGIVEARGPGDEMYGFERLKNFVESHHSMEAEALRQAIVENVRLFAKGVAQSDDITCIVLRFE